MASAAPMERRSVPASLSTTMVAPALLLRSCPVEGHGNDPDTGRGCPRAPETASSLTSRAPVDHPPVARRLVDGGRLAGRDDEAAGAGSLNQLAELFGILLDP